MTWWERAAQIRGIVLDVDGVMTDGSVAFGPDGATFKTWQKIPMSVRNEIYRVRDFAGGHSMTGQESRAFNAKYIRKHYGP